MVGKKRSQPDRFVIDFTNMDVIEAASYKEPYEIIKNTVLPEREAKAKVQEEENMIAFEKNSKVKVNKHHINFYNKWWNLSYGREDMIKAIKSINRYISVPQVSKRPTFEFISSEINPNAALMVFPFNDDYTFGIIQSSIHWEWWKANCSTLKGDYRYTTNTVWDTFPFPQTPSINDVRKVANAAKELRHKRNELMIKYNYSLRDLYRILEEPGANPLKDLHQKLDDAVLAAYRFGKRKELLSQLLELNFDIAEKIENKEKVQGPGLPECVINKNEFVSTDCVEMIDL